MKVMDKYVATEFVRHLASVLAGVAAIYLAVDFFERIDDFMEAGLGVGLALKYFFLKIPHVLALVGPVGVLLAALIVFGLMARHLEIAAWAGGGGRTRRLLFPVFILGLLASLALMLFSAVLVTLASTRANAIWHGQVRMDAPVSGRGKDIWFRAEGLIGHMVKYDPETGTGYGITLNWFDPDFNLVRRMDAKKGKQEKNNWRLFTVVLQDFSGKQCQVTHKPTAMAPLDFTPGELEDAVRPSDEMTSQQLSDYIKKATAEGYDATAWKVDLSAKAAFPFVCLIMATLGGALSLGSKNREGLARNIVTGVVLAFGYWVVHSLSLSLGYAGQVPPLAAAWAANLLFAALAIVMVARLD